MNRVYIPYEEAKHLLEEADVLLYRGKGLISSLIKKAGNGIYSHVSLVSRNKLGDWESIELRELKGGRIIDLENEIKRRPNIIDVYRPVPFFSDIEYKDGKVITARKEFIAENVVRCMRKMAGDPYNYRTIWQILKAKIFWFFKDVDKISDKSLILETFSFVCSTAVSHCFTQNSYDLIKNRHDIYVEPSHLALSPRLNYLFTLTV